MSYPAAIRKHRRMSLRKFMRVFTRTDLLFTGLTFGEYGIGVIRRVRPLPDRFSASYSPEKP